MRTVETATGIRPFNIDVPEDRLEDDLRRRIEATRLPSKELVEDFSPHSPREIGIRCARLRLDEGDRTCLTS
jgi:hypothetical protein